MAPTQRTSDSCCGADQGAALLAAISMGSVFMGANSYIGNGPNFMVKAIVEQSGVEMPGFFGTSATVRSFCSRSTWR